eukprot:9586351-Alexandrium_andersonii.AAC.1
MKSSRIQVPDRASERVIGQAAHVCDGIAHDVRGIPEDPERRRRVLERHEELSERARMWGWA